MSGLLRDFFVTLLAVPLTPMVLYIGAKAVTYGFFAARDTYLKIQQKDK